jgi:hypothetical protein
LTHLIGAVVVVEVVLVLVSRNGTNQW